MAVKMRVNSNKSSRCENCETPWNCTKEMYDLFIIDTKFTLCYDCVDEIFHKTLKASCLYNAKLKSQEDQKRISAAIAYKNKGSNVIEPEEKPNCFGMFKKNKTCKGCKYLAECKRIWEDSQWDE